MNGVPAGLRTTQGVGSLLPQLELRDQTEMAVGTFIEPTSLAQMFLPSLSEMQSNRQVALRVDKKVLVV